LDGTDRTRYNVEQLRDEPEAIKYTSEYVRRLLLERHHIRAKLENPGGSIILTQSSLPDFERGGLDYSSEIGNSFHLDLIEIEDQLSELPKGMVDTLLDYLDGYDSRSAAYYLGVRGGVTIRQRRMRALERLMGMLNDRVNDSTELKSAGNGSNADVREGREGAPHDDVSSGNVGPTPSISDSEARDTILSDRKET
jgi:hypothetical protein